MLVENINFLRNHYRPLRELLKLNEAVLKNQPIEVVETKTGLPTVQITVNGRPQLIHSKYDPIKEAERLVQQYAEKIDQYDHIFFYGVGFAYHVEQFLEKYPDKKFTLYEPNPAIFYRYMCQRKIETLPVKQMKHLFVEWNQELGSQFLTNFAYGLKDNVLLVIHPAYSRLFPSQLEQFTINFKNKVQEKRMSFGADVTFAKRWTLNSLMNLPTTLQTPNLLVDKKDVFKDKPVLIVSAGPSLADEYDNLRYIKENGLAYILSVGSANRALIANDILPDAVCTYDPQEHNYQVFMPMLENHIDTIPMIYGTSVGYETIQKYQGPKLHVITSQDTVTPYYMDTKSQAIEIVDDAFSIAIVTLQLLAKMQASMIILVGQNFAFRDNFFYAKDIKRGDKSAEVQEKDLEDEMFVQDVYGNKVRTNAGFNQMRLSFEKYIAAYGLTNVVNTTKGGAAINGAPFIPLEQLMKEKLTTKVVEENWYKHNKEGIPQYATQQVNKMERAIQDFMTLYEKVFEVMREMDKARERKNTKKLETLFTKFDKAFKKFSENDFYHVYVRPMSRVHYEKVANSVKDLRNIEDLPKKAEEVIKTFGFYMHVCREYFNEIIPIVQRTIHTAINEDKKFYPSDCGVFKYLGTWEKKLFELDKPKIKQKEKLSSSHYSKEVGAKIEFQFIGSTFKLLGLKNNQETIVPIAIEIDGKVEKITIKSNKVDNNFNQIQHILFESKPLKKNIMHKVIIEILDDNPFIFTGVEISKDGRLFHVDEVTTVEELQIGKRIRCHYKAAYNKVGQFSGLGEETNGFIPPESSAYPDGDFYFIMVDENEEEGKKLIADRNVQHSISWRTLSDRGHVFRNKKVKLGSNVSGYLGLIRGGSLSRYDVNNEWDKYVISRFREFSITHLSWHSEVLGCHPQSKLQHILSRGVHEQNPNYKTISTETNVLNYLGYLPLVIINDNEDDK